MVKAFVKVFTMSNLIRLISRRAARQLRSFRLCLRTWYESISAICISMCYLFVIYKMVTFNVYSIRVKSIIAYRGTTSGKDPRKIPT